MSHHHSGYTPLPGDRIDIRVAGATVVDADTADVYLDYRDGSTVGLPLDMPGLTISRTRCRECRRPIGDGHKMDCSTGHAETRATEADRTTDVSLTVTLAAAQEAYRRHKTTTTTTTTTGDEPVETVAAADIRVGDVIRDDDEWLRVTRIRRRTIEPEKVALDVETIPATEYVPAQACTLVLAPDVLVDIHTGSSTSALLAAGVATVYEPDEKAETPTAPTHNARIAAELRRRADQIEAIGGDLHEPTLSFYCGATISPGAESERIAAEIRRTIDELGLPEPTTDAEGAMRHLGASASSGGVTVRVSGYIAAPPPDTCTHCGQTCGCGGVA